MGMRELIAEALHEEINAAYARVQARFGVDAGDIDPGTFRELKAAEGTLVDVAAGWIENAVGGDDVLDFDEADAAGVDGTGRDCDERFPHRLSTLTVAEGAALLAFYRGRSS